MWNSMGGWMHAGGWLYGFAVWILIVLGAFLAMAIWGAVKRSGGETRDDPGLRENPLEILEKRYARGDISKQEFEERRRDLA